MSLRGGSKHGGSNKGVAAASQRRGSKQQKRSPHTTQHKNITTLNNLKVRKSNAQLAHKPNVNPMFSTRRKMASGAEQSDRGDSDYSEDSSDYDQSEESSDYEALNRKFTRHDAIHPTVSELEEELMSDNGEIPGYDQQFPDPITRHPYGSLSAFVIEKTKRPSGMLYRETPDPSAKGERLPTVHHDKFKNDGRYNVIKHASGFDAWYESQAVMSPHHGVQMDPYVKQYIRDPTTGEATLPLSYSRVVKYDELQKVLQKADHYFFEDRPNPVAQFMVPLTDPRLVAPSSSLSKLVDKLEEDNDADLPFALSGEQAARIDAARQATKLPDFDKDKEVMSFLENQIAGIYQESISNEQQLVKTLNKVDQRAPNQSIFFQRQLTAQQRRAEFWRKFMRIFTYVDMLHTTIVRCTRATGRVPSYAALIIMGNGNGIFTYGRGKAPEREAAMRIAMMKTRRNALFTPLHENRAPYQRVMGSFKAAQVLLIPQARGIGLRAGRLTFTLLQSVGYKDASAKLLGRRNIWNLVRAWMNCLIAQESYRELANIRGVHYQRICDPFVKAPPIPSREEIQELEDVAATSFREAVTTVFKSRQLFEVDTFKEANIIQHFEDRENFQAKWDRYLDMANVPQSLRLYPGFSEYIDAVDLLKKHRVREELSESDDIHNSEESHEWDDPYREWYAGKDENSTQAKPAPDAFHRDDMRVSLLNNAYDPLALDASLLSVGGKHIKYEMMDKYTTNPVEGIMGQVDPTLINPNSSQRGLFRQDEADDMNNVLAGYWKMKRLNKPIVPQQQ